MYASCKQGVIFIIYFDNASTTKVHPEVLEAMMPYFTEDYGNPGNIYEFGRRAATAVAKARKQVADLIGANSEQIIFTSGGSEANNLAIQGVSEYLLKTGKTHIISSEIEHDSVLETLKAMEKKGFSVELIPPKKYENGWCISEDDVLKAADAQPKTGLVSIMMINNETGIANNIQNLGKECHKRGILFHTDCVQAASCMKLDVNKLDCDFMSISSHKIHGAKGIGALYVRDKFMVNPVIYGGRTQEFGLRGGTENVPGIVGFGRACEILSASMQLVGIIVTSPVKMEELRERLAKTLPQSTPAIMLPPDMQIINPRIPNFRAAFWDALCVELECYKTEEDIMESIHINGDLEIFGTSTRDPDPGMTINLRFDGIDGETLMMVLDSMGVCVSTGSACRGHEHEPSKVLLAIGLSPEEARNSIRVSFSRMTTFEEVCEGAKILAKAVVTLRTMGEKCIESS